MKVNWLNKKKVDKQLLTNLAGRLFQRLIVLGKKEQKY